MSFPYLPSAGIFQQAVDQFRKSIPSTVDAATLKKLGIAPSNEGYIINTLKFLGVVDVENNRTDKGHDLFTTHDDSEFQKGLASIAKEKYSELFDIRGDEAWKLDRDALISFFRTSDKTSEIVGKRQAIAFIAIASIAGQRDEEIQPGRGSHLLLKKQKNPAPKQLNPPFKHRYLLLPIQAMLALL